MTFSLKTQNRPLILAYVLTWVAAIWWLIKPYSFDELKVLDSLYGSAVWVGVTSIITLAIGELIPQHVKLFLVYWKWSNPTPGCRAFSEVIHQDHRINGSQIERSWGALPSDPIEQNRLWYQIYFSVREDVTVKDANRSYLLFRELATLTIFLLIVGTVLTLLLTRRADVALIVGSIYILLYIVFAVACQQSGYRLVANALAVAAAGPSLQKTTSTPAEES